MGKRLTLLSAGLAVAVLVAFAGPAQAAPIGELGILDVSGINPATGVQWAEGDQYRFAFITSTNTGTIGSDGNPMTDIAEFNAHVQALADAASIGGTWKVIGSTSLVDARDNTSTNPDEDGVGYPILLLDGATVVAENNADLWDGEIQHIIDLTETGETKTSWPHTGTYLDGTKSTEHPSTFGTLDSSGTITQGNGGSTTQWIWRIWTGRPPEQELPMYAMSDPLTVVPEPATMGLLALGGLAVLRRRRRGA